jgi:NO-binding membrane sensor protein with MHYT domain
MDKRAVSLILSRNQQSVRVEVLGGIMMGQTIAAMSSNMKSW